MTKYQALITTIAIVAIATIALYALSKGHNAAIISLSFAAIGGAAGFSVARRKGG